MKIERMSLAAGFVAVLILGPAAFSQSHRPALSLQAGGAGHEENNLHAGLAGGVGVAIPLAPRLALTAEIDYWGVRSRTSHRKLYNGRLNVLPILLGLRYEFIGNGYFTPYAVAGGGFVGTKFRIGELPAAPDVTIDQSVRSGWAGYFGAGIQWRLSGFWDFFTEIDYLLRTAPAQTVTRGPDGVVARDDIWVNLKVVYWKFGLRFLF